MTLTQTQLDRLRRDIGDNATAFTDDELQDNWDRLDSAPSDAVRFEAVKGLCYEQLLADATKLHDYTAGAVDEKLDQVYKHLKERLDYYTPALEAARGQVKQILVGKLGKRINPDRFTPTENILVARRIRRNSEDL